MRKIILATVISLFSLSSIASNGDANKIYNYLENDHDAFSMSLSKDMTDFFDLDVDFNGKEKWISGDFSKGKMVIVGHHISKGEIKKMFEAEGYENIEIKSEKGDEEEDNVALLIKRKGKNVAEAHFVVEEDDSLILLSVYGDMKVRDK